MFKRIFLTGCALLVIAPLTVKAVTPNLLKGSVYHTAYQETEIDPLLLYSISLVESAKHRSGSKVAPSKYALRANGKSYYPANKEEAKKTLSELLDEGLTNIDVGLMQVNLHWHGHRVKSPFELLDEKVNLSVATDILLEAMKSSPHDVKTAIGRYHNWTDLERSNQYAERVLRVYTKLKRGSY